ncbi:MAG: hypothetical protein QOK08_1725 [Actinomycetota bacterium]|jgi:CubicO group peptidase (beta-lactamase class C family)|nr:hypothetical protein [Actinomycetota bacterium]
MSKFDFVWQSLDDTVASGHAPGIVAGIRHRGETGIHATGYRAFDSVHPMESTTRCRIASLGKPLGGAIVALMIDEGILELDESVERWLPELADMRVLKNPTGPLDETVAAATPITVEHLLTLTNGIGLIFEETPLSTAIAEQGVGPGAIPPQMSADEYLKRIGALPLAYQPGERWMYSMGSDILSVLIARASGKPLAEVVRERITEPLGMSATSFFASAEELPTAYMGTPTGAAPTNYVVFDPPDGPFSKAPAFETLACGIVSTVPDFLKFLTALADGALLPAELQRRMTSGHLTDEQRVGSPPLLDENMNWGWQVGVMMDGTGPGRTPGSYGWNGGTGTTGFVDRENDLVACVFSQRMMAGPADNFDYFVKPLATLL